MTMKHGMKWKRKLRICSSKISILNLLQKLNVLIAQAVLGGKMELQNRERSFVSLQVIKQRRQFSRRQGEYIKPEGLNIFEDLAEETMEKRRAQLPELKQAKTRGKLAYFSLVKLIIRDRPNGSTKIAQMYERI